MCKHLLIGSVNHFYAFDLQLINVVPPINSTRDIYTKYIQMHIFKRKWLWFSNMLDFCLCQIFAKFKCLKSRNCEETSVKSLIINKLFGEADRQEPKGQSS